MTAQEEVDMLSALLAQGHKRLIETAPTTEDERVFGKGAWVYCSQHMKPHLTGWCDVSVRDIGTWHVRG